MLWYQINAKSQVTCISYSFQLRLNQAQCTKQHLSAAPGRTPCSFLYALCNISQKQKQGVLTFIQCMASGAHTHIPNPSGLTFTQLWAHADILEVIGKNFFSFLILY